jgi:transcription antitermination factor NusG
MRRAAMQRVRKAAQPREVRAVDSRGDLDARFWVLVKSYTGQEWTAAEALRKVGFEVYLPLRLVQHRNGLSGRAALYPRYLFVRATLEVERWQVIFTTKGVAMVMGSKGRPVGFKDSFVQALRNREVDGFIRVGLIPGIPTCDLKPNEQVMVDGLVPGLFQGVDGRRVTVLLSMLSGDSRVTVDLGRVARSP